MSWDRRKKQTRKPAAPISSLSPTGGEYLLHKIRTSKVDMDQSGWQNKERDGLYIHRQTADSHRCNCTEKNIGGE